MKTLQSLANSFSLSSQQYTDAIRGLGSPPEIDVGRIEFDDSLEGYFWFKGSGKLFPESIDEYVLKFDSEEFYVPNVSRMDSSYFWNEVLDDGKFPIGRVKESGNYSYGKKHSHWWLTIYPEFQLEPPRRYGTQLTAGPELPIDIYQQEVGQLDLGEIMCDFTPSMTTDE